MEAYYATVVNVGIVIPLDKGLPEDEIINSLKKCKADAIIYDDSLSMDFEKIIAMEGITAKTLIPMSDFSQDKLPGMSRQEQLQLLASDGMLVKRPILVTEDTVLVGFKEKDWEKLLQK
jgi:arsenate reductase-like glutaredoxin family protein